MLIKFRKCYEIDFEGVLWFNVCLPVWVWMRDDVKMWGGVSLSVRNVWLFMFKCMNIYECAEYVDREVWLCKWVKSEAKTANALDGNYVS